MNTDKKSISTQKHGKKGTKPQPSPVLVAEAQAIYGVREKDRVVDFMGLPGKKSSSAANYDAYFIEVIRKGVPKKVLDHLLLKLGFTEDEMASFLHVSKRTLQRRAPQEALNQEQSERLIELARLYSKGAEVLGGIESFKRWMDTNIVSLGNKKPKDFLDTSIGINFLIDELGRIEHGVYS